MKNKERPKAEKIHQKMDDINFQSKANYEELELIYLVKRQIKRSLCLFIQSGTLLVIIAVFLIAAWLVSICPSLSDFAKVIFQSKVEVNFDSIKDGKILERSLKIPTEILILLALFIWRFSAAAFLKKDSKSNSVENSSK